MGDNGGKILVTVIGLIFVFGAAYQILNDPTGTAQVAGAVGGAAVGLEHVFTGRNP